VGTLPSRLEHHDSQYALAAACMRGGPQLDLLSGAGWWQSPLWPYAGFALVIHSRAAVERLAVLVEDIPRRVAARHGLALTA